MSETIQVLGDFDRNVQLPPKPVHPLRTRMIAEGRLRPNV